MRVIEYGHIKPKKVKCNHCGAILEYTRYDFKAWSPYKIYLECPVCKGKILTDNNGNKFN